MGHYLLAWYSPSFIYSFNYVKHQHPHADNATGQGAGLVFKAFADIVVALYRELDGEPHYVKLKKGKTSVCILRLRVIVLVEIRRRSNHDDRALGVALRCGVPQSQAGGQRVLAAARVLVPQRQAG